MTEAGGNPVCTHCGFTLAEFLARGLLGCPSCYDQLGESLRAELLSLHPLLHRRPFVAPREASDGDGDDIATLRERMGDALRLERYEEAAALRKRLDALGDGTRGRREPRGQKGSA